MAASSARPKAAPRREDPRHTVTQSVDMARVTARVAKASAEIHVKVLAAIKEGSAATFKRKSTASARKRKLVNASPRSKVTIAQPAKKKSSVEAQNAAETRKPRWMHVKRTAQGNRQTRSSPPSAKDVTPTAAAAAGGDTLVKMQKTAKFKGGGSWGRRRMTKK